MKIKRIDYAIDGKDYDEEIKKQRESQVKSENEYNNHVKLMDSNAKKLSKLDKIPKLEVLNVYSKHYNKNTISAYRGEHTSHSDSNTGTAFYGLGRYTTTNKKYANKFGTVRQAENNELPNNPIQFENEQSFQLWTQNLAKTYNTDINHVYNHADIGTIVKKMGYDGLTLGPKSDMIIVKY